MRLHPVVLIAGVFVFTAGCTDASASGSGSATSVSSTIVTTTATATTTATTSSTTTSTTSTSTSTSTTSTTTSTSTSTTSTTVVPLSDPAMPNANRAFDRLAMANPAVTITVVRDGRTALRRASGTTIDGAPATSDSPMVVASVSKLLTALLIARLDASGSIDVDSPWAALTATAHPAWADVTPRELLAHTSGMPVARQEWFKGGTDCAGFLPSLLDQPPTDTRGRWTYSNGNYCALGLLVEAATGLPLDAAAHTLVFEPLGLAGAHLTTGGQLPTDVAYSPGVDRLSRLGGAGAFIVSTDDMAAVFAALTLTDLGLLTWPGVIIDQYGWGHTGTVDGALSCLWVLEGGRTVVASTVSGGSPSTGGDVCDRVVPAVADDLGIGLGTPDRSPP